MRSFVAAVINIDHQAFVALRRHFTQFVAHENTFEIFYLQLVAFLDYLKITQWLYIFERLDEIVE